MKSGKWRGKGQNWPKPRAIALRIVLLAFLWIAGNVRLTDADLSDEEIISGNRAVATTLDLGTNSSINNQAAITFFQTVGLVKGGFDVKGLVIKKEGKENFRYQVDYEQIGGTAEACSQLQMTWWSRDGQKKWSGLVTKINIESELPSSGREDAMLMIERSPEGGSGENCQFDLVFKTIRQNQGPSGGFRDTERLTNLVTLQN